MMDKYYPIASFDAVYVVDLCEPLLNIARRRFKQRGWTNVHVLCQDATEFFLPEWSNGTDPKGSLSFVTLSYSLSMVCLFIHLAFKRACSTVIIDSKLLCSFGQDRTPPIASRWTSKRRRLLYCEERPISPSKGNWWY